MLTKYLKLKIKKFSERREFFEIFEFHGKKRSQEGNLGIIKQRISTLFLCFKNRTVNKICSIRTMFGFSFLVVCGG